MMNNLNNNLAGALVCTFATPEDAETAYNILINRNYTPDQIHVLAAQDTTTAGAAGCVQLTEVFQKGALLSDRIVISGSFQNDPAGEDVTILKHLKACGISELHAQQFETSLKEQEIIIIVNPVSEEDRKAISQEFNYYQGKQINGSEAFTV